MLAMLSFLFLSPTEKEIVTILYSTKRHHLFRSTIIIIISSTALFRRSAFFSTLNEDVSGKETSMEKGLRNPPLRKPVYGYGYGYGEK